MEVQVTILIKGDGLPRLDSTTLRLTSPVGASRIVGDTARLVFERAAYGHLLPTPKREGGRG